MNNLSKCVLSAVVLLLASACSAQSKTKGGVDPADDDLDAQVEAFTVIPVPIEAVIIGQDENTALRLTGGNYTDPGDRDCAPGSGPDGRDPGCVEFARPRVGLIEFSFEQGTPDGWEFEHLHVCRSNEKVTDLKECRMTVRQRLQFAATVDNRRSVIRSPSRNGLIRLDEIPGSERSFQLYSANNARTNFFYRVRACLYDSDGDLVLCRTSDPKLKNLGRR